MTSIRLLYQSDQKELESFLLPRMDSSMFLLGNSRSAGLEDHGQPYQGTYVAAFENEQIVSVVAHYWNGMLIVQASKNLAKLASLAIHSSKRLFKGVSGPNDQVRQIESLLQLYPSNIQLAHVENLYAIELDQLIVPEQLRTGRVKGRRIEPRDIDLITQWRVEYSMETLGAEDSPTLRSDARDSMERMQRERRFWILEENEKPVAKSGFNTAIKEAVQIGGVYTPPTLRGMGYGRCAVAASLFDARNEGVTRSILFTGEENVPAQRAYLALGYQQVGHYGLVMLREPIKFE